MRNLGVWDSEFLAKDKKAEEIEKYHQQVNAWIDEQTADCCYVTGEKNLSVANEERQLGKPVHTNTFIQEVRKYQPRLKFFPTRWFDPESKVQRDALQMCEIQENGLGGFDPVTGVFSSGHDTLIRGYLEPVIMPEYSVMQVKEQRIPTKERNVSNGAMQQVKRPWREEVRGWRSVLFLLVLARLITIAQAETLKRKFGGTEDRQSWQVKMGKTLKDTAPF